MAVPRRILGTASWTTVRREYLQRRAGSCTQGVCEAGRHWPDQHQVWSRGRSVTFPNTNYRKLLEKTKDIADWLKSQMEGSDVAVNPVSTFRRQSESHERGTTFIARTLANKIRSLITCIDAYADMLGETLENSEQRDLLFRIMEGTARIEHIISDLFLYTRPISPSLFPVRLHEFVSGFRRLAQDDRHHRLFILEEYPRPSSCVIDVHLMQQALFAIVENAFEASPEDANVTLAVRMTDEDRPRILISVRNFGHFNTHVDRDSLFEPFYTTKSQNLGLGLTICRRIVHAHDGQIAFFERENPDSTIFEISLPVAGGR